MRKKKRTKMVKIRKRQKNNILATRYKNHHRGVHIFVIISIIIASLILVVILIQKTIFASKYKIGDIQYNEESVKTYDDPYIYKAVSQQLLGKNYYRTQRFSMDNILQEIQSQYPLVKNLEIKLTNDQTIQVTLLFHDPTLVFRTPTQRIAVYKHHLYPLVKENSLAHDSVQIDLPKYTSGFNDLHGILYKIPATKIKTITTSIYDTLGKKNIDEYTYLPGGQLIFLRYKGKQVYINIKQNIDAQLIKLIDLENRYPGFTDLQKIDVGSSDDIIVR